MATLERQRVLPFGKKLRPIVETVTGGEDLRIIGHVSVGMIGDKGYMGLNGLPGRFVEPGDSIRTVVKRRIGKTIVTLTNN